MTQMNKAGEKGMTVVEGLIAMGLLLTVMALFTQNLQNVQRQYVLAQIQTEHREQLRIMRENVNRELRRAIYFFPPATVLPANVASDAVPALTLAGMNAPGNALCFVGMEMSNMSTLPGNAGAAANARVQLFSMNCLYLRPTSPGQPGYDSANPRALKLTLYQDKSYYNSDPATVLWPKGVQPGNTQAWIVHLNNNGYIGWTLPSPGTAVAFPPPSAYATRRVLGNYLGTNPTKATPLNADEYGLAFQFDGNNAVSEHVTLSKYSHQLKSLSTSSIMGKVQPRNLRID